MRSSTRNSSWKMKGDMLLHSSFSARNQVWKMRVGRSWHLEIVMNSREFLTQMSYSHCSKISIRKHFQRKRFVYSRRNVSQLSNNLIAFFIVFVVQYTPTLIHAIDGINHGLILVPVCANFLMKIYDRSMGESFSDCILPILELQSLIQHNQLNWHCLKFN